ncbi:MAG: hypothetical protein HQ559_03135 [Lentisphaerae bacterium]|nr:hypothetical protein [Lentisphaerota bacterium]
MTSWHVLYLRPRCEKKMAEYSDIHKIKYYLPLRRETKVYQRRKVTVDKPIFPGYFFSACDDEQRITLLKTNHIVRVLEPDSQRRFLHELAQIRAALAVDPSLGACEMLETGRRVRIVSGPFQGIEGTVATFKANTLVLLNVEMIGQAVSVEVARDYLDVID